MKRLAPLAVLLAAALSVSAVAQPPPPAASAPKPRPQCFWIRNITNFAASDTQTLYLRVGGNQVWALTLFANCLQLNWVNHLAVRSRGLSSNVCEGRNPPIDVVLRDVGVGRQSCPVTDVRRLTPEQAAALPPLARP